MTTTESGKPQKTRPKLVHKMLDWEKDAYAQKWLNSDEKRLSERTVESYRESFPYFLDFLVEIDQPLTPDQIAKERKENSRNEDEEIKRKFERVVLRYKNWLIDNSGLSPSTIAQRVNTVRAFFSSFYEPLEYKRKDMEIEVENKVIKRKWVLSNEEARAVYGQLKENAVRCAFLIHYQSGLLPADLYQLKIEQFEGLIEAVKTHDKDFYVIMRREKTNIIMQTCFSSEALLDLYYHLNSRGFPKEGALLINQREQPLNERNVLTELDPIIETFFGKEKAKKFQLKNLRDAYGEGLRRTKMLDETKDTMFGHKPSGAKSHYERSEQEIREAYAQAMQYLSVNHGVQARRDLEDVKSEQKIFRDIIGKQQEEIRILKTDLATIITALRENKVSLILNTVGDKTEFSAKRETE